MYAFINDRNIIMTVHLPPWQATEYSQDTVVDANGVHQGVAENVTDESTRTVVGGFGIQTETNEDV